MQRLQLALQAFESLSSALHTALDVAISDRTEAWLRDDVCRVVEELTEIRSFQTHARWSIDHLAPGANTAARRAVDRVAQSLGALAQAMEMALSGPGGMEFVSTADEVVRQRETIAWLATRPWIDLVSLEDFFQPRGGLQLRDGSSSLHQDLRDSHRHEFDQKELRIPLGDYIARAMFARVEFWGTLLDRLAGLVLLHCAPMNLPRRKSFRPVMTRKRELKQAILALKNATELKQTARLRDASASLLLVYKTYAVHSQLDWLGALALGSEKYHPNIRWCIRRPMPARISGSNANPGTELNQTSPEMLCDPHTVRQIALALEEIRPLYGLPEDPDELIDSLKDTARLLMVDRSPRQVYWEGQPIADTEWDSSETQWNLLWTLAQSPGHIVDQQMLKNPDKQKMVSRRSRLKTLLMERPALNSLISTQRSQGYRLDLEPEDLILLQDDGNGLLKTVSSHRPRTR